MVNLRRSIWIVLIICTVVMAQVPIGDFVVNDVNQNLKGVGRTAITAKSDGSFAIAWQDFNDYSNPVAEQPRVAVQMFDANASPVGGLNLFRGESRSLSIWTSDFLTGNTDLAYFPDGSLLVAVEHRGDLSVAGDFIRSSETGLGVITASGQIIDASGPDVNGVIYWLIPSELDDEENPRVDISVNGGFVGISGPTFDTNRSAVVVQQFDAQGSLVGDFFTPHVNDPGPQANHRYPDVATNGQLFITVWQDGRQDANWDISAQFYNSSGAMGNNLQINSGEPAGTVNVLPSCDMNDNGSSVVVWADTRNNANGEIFGQRYNSSGQPVGGNFQISEGQGVIVDRPEVAMRSDGSFMVVWTDSMAQVSGLSAYRARGHQFDANGNATGSAFIVPEQDGASGLVTITTDGNYYYCAWLDNRLNTANLNVYANKMESIATNIATNSEIVPATPHLSDAYPNPFNATTHFNFKIPNKSKVVVEVFDLLGQKVATVVDGFYPAGSHRVSFNAESLSSGLYFYRMRTTGFTASRKIILLK